MRTREEMIKELIKEGKWISSDEKISYHTLIGTIEELLLAHYRPSTKRYGVNDCLVNHIVVSLKDFKLMAKYKDIHNLTPLMSQCTNITIHGHTVKSSQQVEDGKPILVQ